MIHPQLLLKGATLVIQVAEIAGMVDGISSKLDKLMKSELDAGIRTLKQAATSDKEKEFLLREARVCFNKAADMESDEMRKASALYGLSVCHQQLGDEQNFVHTLKMIDGIQINSMLQGFSEAADSAAKVMKSEPVRFISPLYHYTFGPIAEYASDSAKEKLNERIKKLDDLKKPARDYLATLKRNEA